MRLAGGEGEYEGLVQVTENLVDWKYLCGSDNFDINDVIVICRQLGYPGTNRAITSSRRNPPNNNYPMFAWAFTCTGNGEEYDIQNFVIQRFAKSYSGISAFQTTPL